MACEDGEVCAVVVLRWFLMCSLLFGVCWIVVFSIMSNYLEGLSFGEL